MKTFKENFMKNYRKKTLRKKTVEKWKTEDDRRIIKETKVSK